MECKKSEGDFLRSSDPLNKVTTNSGIIYAMSIIRGFITLLNQGKLILTAALQIMTIDVTQGMRSGATKIP